MTSKVFTCQLRKWKFSCYPFFCGVICNFKEIIFILESKGTGGVGGKGGRGGGGKRRYINDKYQQY